MSGSEKQTDEITKAAEALVRAAVSQTDTASVVQAREGLEKLGDISKNIKLSKESSDAKLNTIQQKIELLASQSEDNAKATREQTKEQRIQFANSQSEIAGAAFDYY